MQNRQRLVVVGVVRLHVDYFLHEPRRPRKIAALGEQCRQVEACSGVLGVKLHRQFPALLRPVQRAHLQMRHAGMVLRIGVVESDLSHLVKDLRCLCRVTTLAVCLCHVKQARRFLPPRVLARESARRTARLLAASRASASA